MQTTDRAQRVAELVEAALERDRAAQDSFLREACGDDVALRAEVESLLNFQSVAEGFIEEPALHANAELLAGDDKALAEGAVIGDYRVLSVLGEGGMGEVYLAQDTALGRRVALKLVKRFGGTNLLRHFRQEERILAGLNHPNVARLYGAGVTEAGMPYFVMEYVEGERLDEYCQLRGLGIPERLQLFRKICSAVAYAHQHLVIHRDLKPANIRVTPEGEPKLLDFGIAKLLDPDEAELPQQTITLMGVMTPEYASPEQVRGETMTTVSDVYSLGVVLYELLTGEKPYRLTSRRPDEIARAIAEKEPERPSTVFRGTGFKLAANRNAKSVATSLRGDLDNIVMMALRKEPERRYASVARFSEDIRRHLEGLPVSARKDTFRYRSAKFIQRHKAAVLGAALITLALLGGIVTTSWQARVAQIERARAEQRFNDVRKLANSYLFEIHDAIENLPGSTPAREILVKRALEYLDSLARESGDDLSLQREVVMAYLKVGNVQGNPRNANLGNSAGALESYRKALAIAEKWPPRPGDSVTRRPLALLHEKIADVEAETNQVEQAVQSARASLAIFQELAAARPGDADAQRSVAISHLKTGDVLGNPNYVNLGDQASAMENYHAAVRILETLYAADPRDARTRRFLGIMHERIGAVLELQGDIPGALTEYRRSAEIRIPLAAEFPNDSPIVRDAAIAYEKIGNVMTATGNLPAALENRQKSLQMFGDLVKADPNNTLAKHSLAVSRIHLGDLLGNPDVPNLGRRSEAGEQYREAIAILESINRADAANAATRRDLAEAQAKLEKLSGE
ncbi:MAG: protein kinase [Chthoniobacterales bacterium]